MRNPSTPLSRRRLQLAIGTALGSLAAMPALAQTMPSANDATVVHVDGGSAPTFSTPGGTLQVDLNARNTVIDWNGFNIPADRTIHFNEDRVPALRDERAVLNRDVSGRGSELFGNLTSSNNIAVWVYNPNGILVGPRASFNTGSLILTTLNPTLDDFRNNRSEIRFTGNEQSSAAIRVANGAQIRTGGSNSSRGLVMIAPAIDADGTFVSTGRDIAFVTASDVTLRYSNNSPLSVTLHRGTAVPGRSQYVRGSVDGNNAIFALASQATITDALLQVDARVTTASEGTRGIILSAGKPAQAASGVTVEGTDAQSGGVGSLLVNGNLFVDDGGGSRLKAVATGTARFLGNLTSDGDVRLTAAGALEVAGGVDSEGQYLVSGRGVTLGNGGADPVTQTATGRILIASQDGNIAGLGNLTLRTGGNAAIELATSGASAGDILLGGGTTLTAGNDRGGNLIVRQRSDANVVALGDVTANTIQSSAGAGAVVDGLYRAASVTLGDVDVRGGLQIEAVGITAGSLASNQAVRLRSTAGIATGPITARNGGVFAEADGALTIGGDVSAAGALTLRGASVRFDGARASSTGAIDILARSGGISSAGAFALGSTSTNGSDFIRLQAGGPEGIVFASGSAITGGANRALRVGLFTAAEAPLVLGDVTARSLGMLAALDGNAAQPGGAIVRDASLAFGVLNLVDGFAAESVNGDLSVGGIAVTGNGQGISLRAANGTLTAQNSVSASGDVTLASGSALSFDTVESRDGRTALTSGGAVTLGRLAGALGVSVQGASLDIDTLASGGAVSAVATTGAARLGSIAGTTVDATAATTLTLGSIDASGAIALTGTNGVSATGLVESDAGGLTATAASGGVSLTGGVRAGGAVALDGTSIALGGQHDARGAYRATARAGSITGAPGLSITADSQGGTGGLQLAATGGGVLLDAATALRAGINGGSAITIAADGAGVRFGSATGASLSITGASDIQTGDITLRSDLALAAAGGVTTGAVATGTGAVTIDGGTGLVRTGAITTGGTASLTGAALEFGRIEAASFLATAASGNVAGGDVVANGGATVEAGQGSLTLGNVRADSGNVTLAALGPLQLGGVRTGGTATLSTGAAGAGIALTNGLEATGSVSVTSGGDILGPFIRSLGGDLTVTAPNGRVGGLNGGAMALQAGPGRAFSLTVGTDAQLGDIVGSQISIAATALTVGSINSNGRPITLAATAGDLNVLGTLTGSDISASATGNARLVNIDATGAVTLNGGAGLRFGDIGGASLAATSSGAITGNNVVVAGPAEISGTTLTLGNLRTDTGAVTLAATGAMQLGSVRTGGAATLSTSTAGEGIVLTNGLEAAGSVSVTSGGDILGPFIRSFGGDLTVAAPNGRVGGLNGGAMALQAGAGRAFSLTVGTDALLGDIVASQVSISATALTVGSINSNGRPIALAATAGDLNVLGTLTGSDVSASATGNARLVNIDATDAVTLNAGAGLRFGNVGGGSLTSRAGGAIEGNDIAVAGLADLAGGAVTLGDVQAGSMRLVASQGDVTTRTLTANGTLAVEGGGLTLGIVTAGNFDAVPRATLRGSATGAIEGGSIDVRGASELIGGRMLLGSATAVGGLRLAALQGDLNVGSLRAGGDAVIEAAGLAQVRGAVIAGGDYRVAGARVALGEAAVEQRADGAVRIVATQGDIAGAAGLRLVSDADASAMPPAGTLLQARPGGGATLGIRAGSGRTIGFGNVEAGRIGGWDGATVTQTLAHDSDFTAGNIRAASFALALSAGNVALGDTRTSGALSVSAARGGITTGDLTGGAIDLAAGGGLSTRAIEASGDVALSGERIDVIGRLATARQLLARARQALTVGDVSSGGAATLESGGALRAGQVDAGGALALTSGADLTLISGRAGGAVTIDANGVVRSGALTGGPSIDLTANDAELTGAIRAGAVSFVNRAGATGSMRVGDGTQASGFRLSDAEVGLVTTDRLRFEAGAGALEIGTLGLAAGAGRAVEMLGTADVRVTGVLSSDNIARSIRIGGDAAGGTDARTLHVVATSSAGGRLLVQGADLDLRANRIAMGLAPGFIETLGDGPEGLAQANALISNPNSALYNPLLGGGFYDPDATTTVAARSLTMRIGDYGLIQNTAVPGQLSGVVLGGTQSAPVQPALRVAVAGPNAGAASFAIFGSINGIGDATAALLGSPVFEIDPRLLPNSRINGCPAGSGVGCLTTIVIQPTLQVFTWDSETIFGIGSDVAVPFAPIVSGNNEELLTGLPALLPEQPSDQE